MQGKLYLLSLLTGVGLCLCDRFQPFHLRTLRLEGFSAETELAIREWSDSFLAFHPAWLLAKKDLSALGRTYPLTVSSQWSPMQGALSLTAVPFSASMKLVWHHADYLTSQDGTTWRSEQWTRGLSAEIPNLPELRVGSRFPLMEESDLNASLRLKVPYAWLAELWEKMHSIPGVKPEGLELNRRGGEDVVACVFVPDHGKGRFSFIGLVSGLEKSLIIVGKLTKDKPDQSVFIDATYEDKIIIRRESDPVPKSS